MKISRRALLEIGGITLGGSALSRLPHFRTPVAQAAVALVPVIPQASRNSVVTRSGPGPMYWSPYSWDYQYGTLTESVWQQNIDWVSATFLPFGYDLVCTDGWVDYTQNTTANGYIQSYSDTWAHDWAYWSAYLADKGMKLGVYYNPLWVTKSAVNDSSKTVVGLPGVSVGSIVDSGDYLNSDGELYWVDVTKTGAKEFIQGYVNYFKQLGVTYLRTDFWSWYESGNTDGQGGIVAHGSTDYATALAWISQAAGDDLELSVVMPNLFNDAATEVRYGDLVRIDNDATTGGWTHLSAGRQSWQDSWSQWDNTFCGFTGWAHRSGRGELILDGDFLMMSSFASDAERQTAINIFTIAGSPIAISDRVDTIGSEASFYQNTEILDLRAQGLVGKPYFYNGTQYSLDSASRDTERWAGQLPDGSWSIALFNRNDTDTVTKTINFNNDLGIVGPASSRDLWAHAGLGTGTQVSPSLAPHASQLIHVVPRETTRRYQAAFAAWGGGANFNNNHTGYSAMGFVDKLEAGSAGAQVTFAVAATQAGSYTISYRYANATGAASTMTIAIADVAGTPVSPTSQVSFPNLADWDSWATIAATVQLAAGTNLVTICRTADDIGAINLNYLEVSP